MDSPIPIPPDFVVNSGLNICLSCCGPIPGPLSATDTMTPAALWTSDLQEPRPILRRHRVDGVCDQVQKHLLELDSISSDLRYVCMRRCLDQYAVLLQIGAQQGDGFSDHFVDVERSFV